MKSIILSLCLLVASCKVFATSTSQSVRRLSECGTALESIGSASALDPWIKDLVKFYKAPTQEIPASFKPESFWSQIKNEVFLRSFRIHLLFYSTGISEMDAGQLKDLSSEVRNILNQIDRSAFGWAMKGSLFNTMSRLTAKNQNGPDLSSLGKTLAKMRTYHSEFKEDINSYKNLYGEEFFTPEVLARGTINTQTMKLFALVDKDKTLLSRDAANAIALLHPITDEALDKGKASKKTLKKLTSFLETQKPTQIETPYERVLFGLLGYIYRDFPPAQHPVLFSMLKRLHFAQLHSLSQKGQMSDEELIDLTFEKGGLSTAIAGYLALGGLTQKQYEFFFKAGAIFQIMDDLLDISIDLEEGNRTVWTTPVSNHQSLLPALDRFLALESGFETELDGLVSDFGPSTQFGNIYRFAYKLTLMRGISRNIKYFAGAELRQLRQYFPISFATLQKFFKFTSGANDLVPEDISEIIKASEAY